MVLEALTDDVTDKKVPEQSSDGGDMINGAGGTTRTDTRNVRVKKKKDNPLG